MDSKDKLAAALEKAGAPPEMIEAARQGRYSDYDSPSATPIFDLVTEARKHGLEEIVSRAMDGEFDATKEESVAWAERMKNDPVIGPLLKQMGMEP